MQARPCLFAFLGWSLVTLLLYWLAGRFFPLSRAAFWGGISLLPLAIYARLALLARRSLIALRFVSTPAAGALLFYFLAPTVLQDLVRDVTTWLLSQGLPFRSMPPG